jgi:uncharacterized repeat protein (TIGR02543 family)
MEEKDSRKVPQSSFRGLYRHVKVSVATLDKIIIGGIAAIVILVLYGVANNGYVVTFDSKGGSDVPSQDAMYADYVIEPEDPYREGYAFTGWYSDENCIYLWNMENDQISQSMTLYAGWEKIE